MTLASSASPPPVSVFISYSHRDEEWREELDTHLANLKRQGKIQAWHDRAIEAGTEWDAQIKHQLETSEVILLLITPRFMASDYCYDLEMQGAIARHNAGTARVIPIILKPVDWQGSPFSKLQVLPKDAKPVTQWADQDEAFLNVVQGIRQAVESLQAKKPKGALPEMATINDRPPHPSHNLTERQLSLLMWMVQEVRAAKLDEEQIWILWTYSGTSIQSYQGEVPEIKKTTLEALERNNCIVCERKNRDEYRFSLTRRAYEVVESGLGTAFNSSVHLQSSPASVSSQPGFMTSFQRQRLEKQQADLQELWNLKTEQLKKLREALVIEAGASAKFQLEKQVQAAETELTQLGDKLEEIEQILHDGGATSAEASKK